MIQMLSIPVLMCLILVLMLGYLGIHVLQREIIFIDIALAQLAAMGAIAAHLIFHAHENSLVSFIVSLGFIILASGVYALVRKTITQIPIEAVIGITYAITAAGALFLVGVAPGGHTHIQDMLAGSLLWVTGQDVIIAILVYIGIGILFWLFRKPMLRVTENYSKATRSGEKIFLWDFLFYVLCGIVITLAVRVSGVVLVFAFLIIPATISAIFASSWAKRLYITWGVGILASIAGLVSAYHLDCSTGPSITTFLGGELALAGIYSLWRHRRSLKKPVSSINEDNLAA